MDVEAYGRFMREEEKKKKKGSQGNKKPVSLFLGLYKSRITRDK